MTDADESRWLCCFLLRIGKARLAEPYCLGPFEITRKAEWSELAEQALELSAKSFGLDMGMDFARARFVLRAQNKSESLHEARLYMEELRGMLPLSIFLWSRPTVPGAGYMMNLETGAVSPISPPREEAGIEYPSFQIDERAVRAKIAIDSVLGAPPEATGEVGKRLRRSVHWRLLARETEDLASRLLSVWIAAECLTRVEREEVLTQKLLAALGMPEGRYLLQLSPGEIADFKAQRSAIDPWRKRLKKVLANAARPLRNGISHEGVRELEIRAEVAEDDTKLTLGALELLVPRLQTIAILGINRNITTLSHLWKSFGVLFPEVSPDRPTTEYAIKHVIPALNHRIGS